MVEHWHIVQSLFTLLSLLIGFLTRRTQSVEDYRKHRFSLTLGRKRTSWLSLRTDSRPSSFSLLVSDRRSSIDLNSLALDDLFCFLCYFFRLICRPIIFTKISVSCIIFRGNHRLSQSVSHRSCNERTTRASKPTKNTGPKNN